MQRIKSGRMPRDILHYCSSISSASENCSPYPEADSSERQTLIRAGEMDLVIFGISYNSALDALFADSGNK